MNDNWKVEIPFYYASNKETTSYFEGVAIYFFTDYELVFETVKATKIILRPRDCKNKKTCATKNIRKKDQSLQIRFNLLKENEILNSSNRNFNIEISENDEILKRFNEALIKQKITVNNLYLYVFGVNPSGHNEDKKSKIKMIGEDFHDCQFIQFFTYVLGNHKRKQKVINFNNFQSYPLSFAEFYKEKLNEYFKLIFNIINNLKVDSLLLSKKQQELIKNEWDWKTINNEIRNYLKDNLSKNANNESLLETYICSKRDEYRKNVDCLINECNFKYDSVYQTYLIENGYVQKCHILEVNQVKKNYYETKDINVLDDIANENNVLFLTPTIHFLWDKEYIKLLNNGSFKNLKLNHKEWDHLKIEQVNVLNATNEIRDNQLSYLKKRNLLK